MQLLADTNLQQMPDDRCKAFGVRLPILISGPACVRQHDEIMLKLSPTRRDDLLLFENKAQLGVFRLPVRLVSNLRIHIPANLLLSCTRAS